MLRRNKRHTTWAVNGTLLLGTCLVIQGLSLTAPISAAAAETNATAQEDQDSRVQQEKEYFRQALDELEDMGLSPIRIWSDITGNSDVMERVDDLRDSVTEAVTEKVSDAQDVATQAVSDAVQKETEKVKKSLIQMLREEIQDFLDGILG